MESRGQRASGFIRDTQLTVSVASLTAY